MATEEAEQPLRMHMLLRLVRWANTLNYKSHVPHMFPCRLHLQSLDATANDKLEKLYRMGMSYDIRMLKFLVRWSRTHRSHRLGGTII